MGKPKNQSDITDLSVILSNEQLIECVTEKPEESQHQKLADKFDQIYPLWVPGPPIPKSTQKPPRGSKGYIMRVVSTQKKYAALWATWRYQRHVSEQAMLQRVPVFEKDEPIMLSFRIYKVKHERGDLKNISAAVEDGLALGGHIFDDGQVLSWGHTEIWFNAGEDAGVQVTLQLDPRFRIIDGIIPQIAVDHFKSKKKAQTWLNKSFPHSNLRVVGLYHCDGTKSDNVKESLLYRR